MSPTNLAILAQHFVRAKWRWQQLRGAALERYQEERAQRIVAYAQAHSPFYREHWAGHDLRQWRTLPTVDKALMMEHFSTFNTRGITTEAAMQVALQAERSRDFSPTLDDVTVGLSSGTSGHRGLFMANQWEQSAWAGTIMARVLHHMPTRRLRVAFFLRSNNNLYERIGGTLIQFRYFDLMLPLAEAVASLNTLRPDIVVGPPSLLGFLAQEQERGQLHIQPRQLISVAEVLEEQDRARIEAIFHVPVEQIYQSTEGLLAVSCARGSLHIQEDIVAIQFEHLDADSERVMPIVTDLWRTTQPIIRYRLNDVLQLAPQPCSCGSSFRVIKAIEGRCDDICYFESLTGEVRAFYPDTIRRMILLASPDIEDYHVTQQTCGHLNIRLKVQAGFEAIARAVRASVQATLAQYSCQPALVSIESGIAELSPGVKRRRVQRLWQYSADQTHGTMSI